MTDKRIDTIFSKKKLYRVPIWFMRQAGRYLPEYRNLRSKFPCFIEFCMNQNAVIEATLQPIKRFELDAAIIFSDILIIPYSLGVNVQFLKNKGPILEQVNSIKKLKNLSTNKTEDVFYNVYNAINKVKNILSVDYKRTSLIGFAGSPWTVACYMVEGQGSKNFAIARKLAYKEREFFDDLIELLVKTTTKYLCGQIESGAEIIKLFDSWAGLLPKDEYFRWVINPTKKIVKSIKKVYPNVPIIGFPRGSGEHYINYAKITGVDVVAIDETVPILWAKNNLQNIKMLQGNLDNVLLTADNKELLSKNIEEILEVLGSKPFIFNLGHGILPNTCISSLKYAIEKVRNYEKCKNHK